jgi:serine/threonine protein kinase/tetratricopeptide (TPR) repeat protein
MSPERAWDATAMGAAASARERQRAAVDIMAAVLDLPLAERASYLERTCGNDPALRGEVHDLLQACERVARDDGFLSEPAESFAAIIAEVESESVALEKLTLATLRHRLAGRYDIEHELGRGGMATVYLARDQRHDRHVAIKVIHPELTSDIGAERFLREITIAAGLRHPHIVPLYDSGEVGGLPFYVMPYVTGESLRQRMDRERQLDITDAICIARDVAEALDYAHAHGIIHRDIKPQNILLEEGHALVADFGIARAVEIVSGDELTDSGIIVGTPPYMSPEQADGEVRLDGRSDVYSLACVLYEMLCGEPPFTGSTPRSVGAKHMYAAVPSLRVLRPTVPVTMQRVLERGLAKVPADRFMSAGEFVRSIASSANVKDGRRLNWRVTGRSLLGASAILLALSLPPDDAASDTRAARRATASDLDPRSIAVLYFNDLTPTKTLTHIATGLTEDLIDVLSQVPGLRVTSPNGVRAFPVTSSPLDSIARRLGVGTMVSGTVAQSADRLRFTVRLIDAVTGQQLQSRTLERRSTELFALQDSLTADVALFLRERLGREIRLREHRSGAKSLRAWESVQLGEQLAREGAGLVRAGDDIAATRTLLRADSLFARAQRDDPSWIVPTLGRGWAALSLSYVSPGPEGAPAPPPAGNAVASARTSASILSVPWLWAGLEHAAHALRQSPGAPEALALRGDLRYRLVAFGGHVAVDSLLSLAENDLSSAVEARPDFAGAWYSLGDLYYRQARFAESLRALRMAFDRDVFLTEIRSVVARLVSASLHAEQFDAARSWCALGQVRYAGDPRFGDCKLTLLGWTARGDKGVREAWQEVRNVEMRDSSGTLAITWAYRRTMVAAILARSGRGDSARAVLGRVRAELSDNGKSNPAPVVEAYVRTLLGERDQAIEILKSVIESQPDMRPYVARTPWFRDLHSDPRFDAMVRQRG